MGIQINGQTDTISASDGGLAVSGYELTGASNINVTGIVTATGLDVTNIKHPSFGSNTFVLDSSGNINIDSGGVYYDASNNRFGIGTASPGSILHLQQSASAAVGPDLRLTNNAGTASDKARVSFFGGVSPTIRGALDFNINSSGVGELIWSSGEGSVTERMRITSQGYLKASNTGSYNDVSAPYHETRTNQPDWALHVTNTHGSNPYGVLVSHSTVKNTTGNWFFYAQESSSLRFQVRSNGGIANYQGNDANLCDEREKKNIETLDSTWSCLKNWELKKFHYNEDADSDDKRYGVIAQQVAPHCPEVITDWIKQEAKEAVLDDDGNVVTPAVEEIVRMGVKEQQMMWMAIKALQEAQTRIETLEAKVAALEAQ